MRFFIREFNNGLFCVLIFSAIVLLSPKVYGGRQPDQDTRSPIHHIIVIVGENRSFDNVFATYQPLNSKESIWNLLSLGIVNVDGSPGPNFVKAAQQQAKSGNTFELSPTKTGLFNNLPQPNTSPVAFPVGPCFLFPQDKDETFCKDDGLDPSMMNLLKADGTGQQLFFPLPDHSIVWPVPDCRYPSNLPNGPYDIVGASRLNNCGHPFPPDNKIPIHPVRVENNTGDPVHRFYQMWQQSDCAIAHATADNPSGCLNDLYNWVAITQGWGFSPAPSNDQGTYQGGIPMGFFNMARGEWPYFQNLAQQYAISDNYHQPVMGGTGPNSQFIATGDVYYYNPSLDVSLPPLPPTDLVENPDPVTTTNNYYINDKWNYGTGENLERADIGNTGVAFVQCSSSTASGVKPIMDYLENLPYLPFNQGNCASNIFYQVNNSYPYYNTKGEPISDTQTNEFPAGKKYTVGPQSIPTIGDALYQRGISWKYYGGGFDVANGDTPKNKLYCAICNPFQYATSIMTNEPLRQRLVDLKQFYTDINNGTLPAVAFIKPDLLVDGHPGTSTPPLYEAFVRNILTKVQANANLWNDMAIFITFDEAGGYYDSGYIQPIDFFGDGPRTPLILVSPYAKHGHVDHTYTDHASILKFVEWNWKLNHLSKRSRDNLPNPINNKSKPYFPSNSPAIGDLRTLFDFRGGMMNDINCLFNWAEQQYPNSFSPSGSATAVSGVYTFRNYSATNSKLGVSSVNSHVYQMGQDGVLRDEGSVYGWFPKAGCPNPANCLFNWAEKNYSNLFAPAHAKTGVSDVYTYRHYPATNTYLGISSANNDVYYLGSDKVFQDQGSTSNWFTVAGCQ